MENYNRIDINPHYQIYELGMGLGNPFLFWIILDLFSGVTYFIELILEIKTPFYTG
ncbi:MULTISPECIES: hypothetical protein [Tenacibaculum]|uniref:hypothetical protein n=1 Tax=Tenacibaculum TaxID=104267 RepID=UPI0012DFFCE3|nr:hypothetical protein [Tenacibaculum mesophilum]